MSQIKIYYDLIWKTTAYVLLVRNAVTYEQHVKNGNGRLGNLDQARNATALAIDSHRQHNLFNLLSFSSRKLINISMQLKAFDLTVSPILSSLPSRWCFIGTIELLPLLLFVAGVHKSTSYEYFRSNDHAQSSSNARVFWQVDLFQKQVWLAK